MGCLDLIIDRWLNLDMVNGPEGGQCTWGGGIIAL